MAINTTMEEARASMIVMITTFLPFFFKIPILKYSPVPKAIKDNAMSPIKLIPSIVLLGIKLKTKGPIRIPDRMYAVTLGSLMSFVIRVIRKPKKSIKDTDMTVIAVGSVIPILSIKDNVSIIISPYVE